MVGSGNSVPPWANIGGLADSQTAIRTEQLSKSYRGKQVVSELNLEVGRGEIFGFLGPNGAGKTTTIRMLLNLSTPDSGSVELLGGGSGRGRAGVLARVGSLVETPAFYPYLCGRDNLRALCLVLGLPPRQADRALEQVAMSADGGRRFSTYSLGMKQRLGVAAALLGDPELLILDEPANGLDPFGIIQMRGLMRELAAAGVSVFLSSHILAEVGQLCDRVGIIREGRMVLVERVTELLRRDASFVLETDDPEGAARILRDLPGVLALSRDELGRLRVEAPGLQGDQLLRPLVTAGVSVQEFRRHEPTLEEIFLRTLGANAQGG